MPVLLMVPHTAHAQCVSPDAGPGVIIFNNDHKVMQYCNGDDWIGLWGGGGGSGGQRISGEVATFDLTACPEGWSEYLPARGRFVRGIDNGAGNDPSGTRSPGNIQADALGSHNHTGTAASAGAHTHSIDPPATNTNSTGAHTHSIDPPATNTNSAGAHTHGLERRGGDGNVDSFSYSAWASSGWSGAGSFMRTQSAGAHTHSVNIPAFNSASAGAHTHSVNIPAFNSASAGAHTHSLTINATGAAETRPKNVALLYCRKD